MRLPVISYKAAISTSMVAMLLLPMPALAALTSTDAARLDSFEKTVFGSARKSLTEESRLRALETNLFGKAKSGNSKSRLDAVGKLISPNSSSKNPQYLPPLAAQMDRSAFPEPVAPVTTSGADRYGTPSYDNSPSVSHNDDGEQRVKELLREALHKHNQGDRAGAQSLFKKVLAVDPRNSDANFNLGAMAEDAGDLASAQRYYRAAANANPNDSEVRDALASVESKMQQQAQAKQQTAMLEKRNQWRQMAQDAAAAYKSGNYDQAISLLERIDREAPGDANVKYGLGQAYRGKGDMQRARMNLQAANQIDPNNSLYRSSLAELDRQQQQQVARQNQPTNSYEDVPPGARDYGTPVANDYQQAGELTPFAGDDRLYGRAADSGRGSLLGGLGSALGFGGLGAGVGSMYSGGGGYPQMAPEVGYTTQSGRGSRLMRGALTGGLAGAVAGGLGGLMRGSGGVKQGAMRGAMYGGLFGLLSSF